MSEFIAVLTAQGQSTAGSGRRSCLPYPATASPCPDETLASLRHALEAPRERPELLAEDLRLATRALGRITGRVDVEELLDLVFRDFCIGK